MIVGRMRLRRNASHLLEVHYGLMISFLNVLPDRRVEFHRPIVRLVVVHTGPDAQIVNQIAGSQDQHAASSQGRQVLSQFVVKRRWFAVVDAQLNDWNVGLRKHVFQHDPGAVIESPLRIALNGQLPRRGWFEAPAPIPRYPGAG